MTREELKQKLESGESLAPVERALLDAYLEDGKTDPAVTALKSATQHEPSLAWRARLNDRLAAVATTKRRPKTWLLLLPATAVAAGLFGVFLLTRAGQDAKSPEALAKENAETLARWHKEAVAATILPGDGVNLAGIQASAYREQDRADAILYGKELDRL